MSAPTFDEGDTLKTPSGDVTIEAIDGRNAALSDGRTVTVDGIKQGLHYGKLDLVPAGSGERDTYIRFGDIPADEQSTDHSSGRAEAGVSVYACEQEDGIYYPAGNKLQTIFAMLDRTVYLVSGERVGTGADGEPVIRDVEIVADLKTPKGIGGFVPADQADEYRVEDY